MLQVFQVQKAVLNSVETHLLGLRQPVINSKCLGSDTSLRLH